MSTWRDWTFAFTLVGVPVVVLALIAGHIEPVVGLAVAIPLTPLLWWSIGKALGRDGLS